MTLDGTLDMTENYGAIVTVQGGLVLNGTIELGGASGTDNYAYLDFGSNDDNTPQAISGTGTIQFGQDYFGDSLENNSNDTLTIGPNITIQGGLYSTISGAGPIDFQGTIDDAVNGGSLTINAPGWSNNGTITATGATLDLYGNWTNNSSGTITADAASTVGLGSPIVIDPTSSSAASYVWTNMGTLTIANGATVYLGGVFSTDAYESNFQSLGVSVDLAQDNVYLSGTLDNSAADNPTSGGTLALSAATGPLSLAGGEIYQGAITTSGSDALVATASGERSMA